MMASLTLNLTTVYNPFLLWSASSLSADRYLCVLDLDPMPLNAQPPPLIVLHRDATAELDSERMYCVSEEEDEGMPDTQDLIVYFVILLT